ncbi:hypothetical protein Clacol_005722 [Clathrus columnatus]|uniref:Uncharacterized protein n=1 Tax=Clathrus columnatus TaxID=1419009 RepID=A0AAV5AA48_9AGAM|nr:hypothetical protein Clacol_005722 [Clathrus columnatus]
MAYGTGVANRSGLPVHIYYREDVEETLEEYVIQRYLETLWLPESITSLPHFIKDLRRIIIPPNTDPQEVFKPLLLPADAIREKYHVQLSQVLQDEGGAGEIEETMMWFAYGNERYHREAEEGGEAQVGTARKKWLTNMEYRECKNAEQRNPLAVSTVPSTPQKNPTSYTAPTPQTKPRSLLSPRKSIFPPTESMSFKRERAKPEKTKKSHIDIEERLELLMDRLSIAQLMANLQISVHPPSQPSTSTPPQVRDWMQVFCEDVVKPFPFSEDSDSDVAAPPAAPILRTQKKFKAKERCPPSPLKLHEVTKSGSMSMTRTLSEYAIPTGSGPGKGQDQFHHQSIPPKRHRSRSVSVSVEEVRARGASRGGVASSKALFRGEVEMKRTASKSGKLLFQSSTTIEKAGIEDKPPSKSKPTRPVRSLKETKSKTFVFNTPVKKLFPDLASVEKKSKERDEEFVAGDEFQWSSEEMEERAPKRSRSSNSSNPASWIFVEDTPVKRKEGTLPIPTVQKPKSKVAAVLWPDDREPYIFRLPTELLLEIVSLLWSSAVSQEERRKLRNRLPFVCKAFAVVFYHISQQDVTIASPEFYNYYIGLISKLDVVVIPE